jgi:hypothetical protein
MKSRQYLRIVASCLIPVIILSISPLPTYAAQAAQATPEVATRAAVKNAQETVQKDLNLLVQSGKEAYLDNLFERLAADEARAKQIISERVSSAGGRRVGTLILALGSPVLAGVLRAVPESWANAIVTSVLHKFITKTVKSIKGLLSGMSAASLEAGLKAVLRLLGNPSRAAFALSRAGQSWWERFFSDSKMVRNFLIVVVTLSAIGVAVGLAIAGSTVAPIVAVIGALVALIGLLNGGSGFGVPLVARAP